MFKDVYKAALGEKAAQYQTVGFLVSSACAEVIADVLLCPWEAVSVIRNSTCCSAAAICLILFMIVTNCASLLALVEGAHADL